MLELKVIKINKPDDVNIILGQSHFIKTVEDLYEVLVASSPNIKFAIGFCESSGKCLVRSQANDNQLKQIVENICIELSCGHCFCILLKDAYPINVLNAVKLVPEVCNIYCATANPLEVIIAETQSGRGILGVIDGAVTCGKEGQDDIAWRKDLLRKIGYKL